MAYKTFANGFPLPASDLNNYLMNQSVIVFANSTARSAALPTPTEGMLTYLEDTNLLEVYNGSAWADINDNTAAIPKSTVTTAGDLIVADGASSVTRLGVGADGSLVTVAAGSPSYLSPGTDAQVLTLAAGAPTWSDAAGGGSDVWTQLHSGTVGTGALSYTLSGLAASNKLFIVLDNISMTGANAALTLTLGNTTGTAVGAKRELYLDGSTMKFLTNLASNASFFLGKYMGYEALGVFGTVLVTSASGSDPAIVSLNAGTNSDAAYNKGAIDNRLVQKSGSITSVTVTGDSNIDAGSIHVWGA